MFSSPQAQDLIWFPELCTVRLLPSNFWLFCLYLLSVSFAILFSILSRSLWKVRDVTLHFNFSNQIWENFIKWLIRWLCDLLRRLEETKGRRYQHPPFRYLKVSYHGSIAVSIDHHSLCGFIFDILFISSAPNSDFLRMLRCLNNGLWIIITHFSFFAEQNFPAKLGICGHFFMWYDRSASIIARVEICKPRNFHKILNEVVDHSPSFCTRRWLDSFETSSVLCSTAVIPHSLPIVWRPWECTLPLQWSWCESSPLLLELLTVLSSVARAEPSKIPRGCLLHLTRDLPLNNFLFFF